jgi:hypothetical protein
MWLAVSYKIDEIDYSFIRFVDFLLLFGARILFSALNSTAFLSSKDSSHYWDM